MANTDRGYGPLCNHMYMYDLGWLVKTILSFREELDTAIDLKTIHYADPIQWDITTQYSPNTVVVDPKTGTAYMSKVPVPAGVQLDNTDYWVVIFNYQRIYDKIMSGVAFNDKENAEASKDISKYDFVWFGGDLYQAQRDIPQGSKYVPGVNIVATTVADALATYYGRDRVAQVINDTLTASETQTIGAKNRVINVTGDQTTTAGNITDNSDGKRVFNSQDIILNSTNPITYRTPSKYSRFFNIIPFKDINETTYNVLVATENTEQLTSAYNTVDIDNPDDHPKDITNILSSVADNTIVSIYPGNYTVKQTLIINSNNLTIQGRGNVNFIFSDALKSGITFKGDNIVVKGINFTVTDKTQHNITTDIYYIGFEKNNNTVESCSFDYITKYGIYTERSSNGISVKNCHFNGGWKYDQWDGTPPHGNFGIYCKFDNSVPFTGCNVFNSEFSNSVEGIYQGTYNQPLDTTGSIISGCRFTDMFDHGIYLNGGRANNITSNLFTRCNTGVANQADYSSIVGNTLFMADKPISRTGLSVRDAHYCVVTGNTIYGDISPNTVCIDFPTLIPDISDKKIENNIIASNVIRAASGSIVIRMGTTNTIAVNNNIIDGNTIEGGAENKYLITIENGENNKIINNIFNVISSSSGALFIKCNKTDIRGNNMNINFNAKSDSLCALCVVADDAFFTKLTDNTVNVNTGNNVTAAILRETQDNKTAVVNNTIYGTAPMIICSTPQSTVSYAFNNALSNVENGTPETHFTTSDALTYKIKNPGSILNKNALLIPLNNNAAASLQKGYYVTCKNTEVTITFSATPVSGGEFSIIC